MEFRRFTRNDFMAWAGSERFAENENPIIADKDNVCVIIDKTGMQVEFLEESGDSRPYILDASHEDFNRILAYILTANTVEETFIASIMCKSF